MEPNCWLLPINAGKQLETALQKKLTAGCQSQSTQKFPSSCSAQLLKRLPLETGTALNQPKRRGGAVPQVKKKPKSARTILQRPSKTFLPPPLLQPPALAEVLQMNPAHFIELRAALSGSFRQVLPLGCNLIFCVPCFEQQRGKQGWCGAAAWLSPGDVGIN